MLRVGITGIPMVCGGGNHAVVLKGYDDEQGIVYLSDSINGNVTRNAQVFFGTWQQMDSQAVVIE